MQDNLKERLRRIVKKPYSARRGPPPCELQMLDRIEALEAENMMLREERDRLIKFVNIMCEEYGLEYGGVVKQ